MNGKYWYHSRTVWGALMAAAAAIARGNGVAAGEMSALDLSDALLQIIGVFGALLAIYGRVSATDLIR